MATALARLGRSAFRNRRAVLATWLVLLLLAGAAALTFRGPTDNSFSIPGTESQQALDVLGERLPAAAGASADIVFAPAEGSVVTDPEVRAGIADVLSRAAQLPGATVVDPSQTRLGAPDGSLAVARVSFTDTVEELSGEEIAALRDTATQARADGLTVEFGGQLFAGGQPEVSPLEVVGIAIAFVVLIVTFGQLAAAGMPLLTGLIGVGIGIGGLFALTGVVSLSSTAPILALMLGLAVGIDYSLFIVSRHRSQLAGGMDPEESAALASGTAGSAVVFAGLTVIIALSGFAVVGIPFLTVMGLAAAATVLVTVLVALTLVPAMLGFAGARLRPAPGSRAAGRESGAPTVGSRWVTGVTRRPLTALLVGVIGLGVMAIPALDLRLGLPSAATAPAESTQRQAYDLIAERIGPGVNGPLTLVIDTAASGAPAGEAGAAVAQAVTGQDGVAAVTPPQPGPDDTLAVVSVLPVSGPDDEATTELVQSLRAQAPELEAQTGAEVSITGQTALGIDVSSALSDALPVFVLVVVGLALLLLGLVFRSIVVPVKAALGFLLTVGASLGAVVAVFQWGWLSGLVGISETGPIISFLPVLMVGILFGLAMDYQVFLVSRMREDYVHSGDAAAAVHSGFSAGARVVTAAALIMSAVFAGFVFTDDTIIKGVGFALAIGVLIDAFVVRMTIVPAVMALFGERAWWFPAWLDRIVPRVDVEGTAVQGSDAGDVGRHARDTTDEGRTVGVGGHSHAR